MTYYEELGVSQGATVEEIHRAYKRLTKLLHPDQQQDPALRDLAERQMKRLNNIHEILSDPDARTAYDRDLVDGPDVLRQGSATSLGVTQKVDKSFTEFLRSGDVFRSSWAGIFLLITVLIVVAIWFPVENYQQPANYSAARTNVHAAGTSVPSSSISPGDSTSHRKGSSRDKRSPIRDRQSNSRPAPSARQVSEPSAGTGAPQLYLNVRAAVESQPGPADPSEQPLPPPVAPVAAAPEPPAAKPPSIPVLSDLGRKAPPAPAAPPSEPKPTLTGRWIYARSPSDPNDPKLYPPEYIELRLDDDGSRIRATYQARYFVPNRAISPNVLFHFDGATPRASTEYHWLGAGGSKGKITVKLLNPQSIEVVWFATEMGTHLGLGSGSATLIRRQDP